MSTQYCRINDAGEQQILDALTEHCKQDILRKIDRASGIDEAIDDYARDAEASSDNGNGCEFEIEARLTKTGAPVIVRITDDGYGMVDVDVDGDES